MNRRARRCHRHGRQAGFSLLELLVALALLATLTAILMSALQFGAQVWRRGDPAAQGADLAAAYRTLQNNIERALPIPERTEQASAALMAFDGTAEAVTFVVANPGRVGLLGDAVLRIALGGGNGAAFLGISWAPYDPKTRLAVEAFNETLTLLPGIEAVSLRYFGAKDEDPDGARWSGDWQRQTTLPRLIGIELQAADGRRRSWTFRVNIGG